MITLVMTCGWQPEQYDVMEDGHVIGLLRLRDWTFTAHAGPEIDSPIVYEASTIGGGMFEDIERNLHLGAAVERIAPGQTYTIDTSGYKGTVNEWARSR